MAAAAAEQCGRTRVPAIEPVCELASYVHMADHHTPTRWLLSLRGGSTSPLRPAPTQPLVVLSGPEGGLTEAEENLALASDWRPFNLGPRVLRAETAPLAVLAWLGISV